METLDQLQIREAYHYFIHKHLKGPYSQRKFSVFLVIYEPELAVQLLTYGMSKVLSDLGLTSSEEVM